MLVMQGQRVVLFVAKENADLRLELSSSNSEFSLLPSPLVRKEWTEFSQNPK